MPIIRHAIISTNIFIFKHVSCVLESVNRHCSLPFNQLQFVSHAKSEKSMFKGNQ